MVWAAAAAAAEWSVVVGSASGGHRECHEHPGGTADGEHQRCPGQSDGQRFGGAAPAAWWLLVTAVNTVDAAATASAPPMYRDKLEMPMPARRSSNPAHASTRAGNGHLK